MDELKSKILNPRVRETTKVKCKNALDVFNKNFIKLDNGFVIFRYLRHIRKIILKKTKTAEKGTKITYEEILIW